MSAPEPPRRPAPMPNPVVPDRGPWWRRKRPEPPPAPVHPEMPRMAEDGSGWILPAGFEVWEKAVLLDEGTEHIMVLGMGITAEGNVIVSADLMRVLLVDAGYEFRGLADGTATTYDGQRDQQR